ncbi:MULTISPECIES: FAD:protein FMN transferase [unclassified Lysobacter]|uniref:FAD:protein FMN transferase n=1 Tax=unclassified Lysobacter TaxID=2635362 RepID=UPI001BEBBC89|nr:MULTISPECIES: FAD:protein FMN transferase [unclassified Lysobacter]MBT2744919.1 FAD:protein FMN transferase [Lysobacter sp. ISL-42]MBT2752088.1 FAD:protein FMN transferase [Lysobacter sp. ISL-50]MBT2778585.1 FAD:protein FMN transferase [Lysobacter sp. ISL-54]MBT2780484.1 FAD:protein FMN transferase [Lysobacter sp. ISL-52]
MGAGQVKRSLAAFAFFAALSATMFAARAQTPLARYQRSEAHMGTQTRIVLYAADAASAERAMRAGFARIAQLDLELSDYREDSGLMRLAAQAGGGDIAVGEDLFRVLQAGQDVAERSGGAFDVTQGALTRLWRSARKLSELPRSERIERARANGGYRYLHLDAQARTVRIDRPGIGLDVGGIAKGYAADEALAAITRQGVTRALVALGGDIAVSDAPPGAPGWRVSIAPLAPVQAQAQTREPTAQTTLYLRHAAVSTAGDAEQWFEADGRRYSHLIDPRSGWPMQGRSATTVIARRGIDADGLDTAAALLGPSDGARLVESMPGAAMRMERDDPLANATEVRASTGWPRQNRSLYDGAATLHDRATAAATARPLPSTSSSPP